MMNHQRSHKRKRKRKTKILELAFPTAASRDIACNENFAFSNLSFVWMLYTS